MHLTFVNADVAKDQCKARISARTMTPRALVLDIGSTADLDVATVDMLTTLYAELADRSIEFRLAAVRGSVRDRMRRTGLMDIIGEDHCYLSVETAVAASLPTPGRVDPPPD